MSTLSIAEPACYVGLAERSLGQRPTPANGSVEITAGYTSGRDVMCSTDARTHKAMRAPIQQAIPGGI
ncbi:hypothetical protein [Sodalis-like endosymbiont of Proechinophthirus fluctus]|uniref:hypothetical protein n=1 Tax=Sodalis-like endosymbiont of Proechinophthirus fluctus TaxID=1462730 RepID=UPI001FCADD59|nr:hypothetical protein [Sodalis-like endosymbiont of Proechinophthirus fluctus]